MGGGIPVAVTAVGAGLGAAAGAGAGSGSGDSKEGDQTDEGASQEKAGEDPVDANSEGPVGEGVRTGHNRCPECRRRDERYCKHAQE